MFIAARSFAPMLIAALLTACILALLCLGLALLFEPRDHWPLYAMAAAFLVTFAHLLALGIPTTLALKKLRRLNWPSMLAAGFICGLLSYGGFFLITHAGTADLHGAGWRQQLVHVAELGFLGILVSGIYFAALRRLGWKLSA